MVQRNPSLLRRGSFTALCALSGSLAIGCTDAVFDAMAAGGLNFIESGVMTTLSGAVFGDEASSAATDSMDALMDGGDEGHEEHGG